MPSLTLVGGVNAGRRVEFDSDIVIGRSRTSDVLFEDETVSRRHARLAVSQEVWWLEDLGSANGSRLNGVRVNEQLALKDGDRLSLGQLEMVFRLDSVPARPQPRHDHTIRTQPGQQRPPEMQAMAQTARASDQETTAPPRPNDSKPVEVVALDAGQKLLFSALLARIKLFCELGAMLERPGVQQISAEAILKDLLESFPLMDEAAWVRIGRSGEPEVFVRAARAGVDKVPNEGILDLAREAMNGPDGLIGSDFSTVPLALNALRIKSMAAFPVRRGARVWGALCLLSRDSVQAVQASDAALLQALTFTWARVVEAWGGLTGR